MKLSVRNEIVRSKGFSPLLKLRVLYRRKKKQNPKSKSDQGQQAGRLKKPKGMENRTTFHHTTSLISGVA